MDNLKQKISLVLLEKPALGSSNIHQKITESGVAVALVTVKRALTKMKESGLLESSGIGRAITYSLTWKSSRIEGNTYTLLDTEKLILEGIVAPGHSQAETQMILNHKDAFAFI